MKIRILLITLLLLVLVASPLWWPRLADFFRPRGEKGGETARPDRNQRFAMEEVLLVQSRSGVPEWQITADRLSTAAGRESELQLVEVRALFSQLGGEPLEVSGKQATYDQQELVLTLQDEVRVKLPNGYEVQTEMLRYLDRSGKVETGAPVRLFGEALSVQGNGMGYDLKTGSYWVGGRVAVDLQ